MSESHVETLEKALGLQFISKMGLTCFRQLESHVEFTASNFDDAWQFFHIVRNPNITVSNRKRDLNSHLTSRSVCIFLPPLVYIPEFCLIPRQVPDFNEQTRVSNGHPRCTREYTPGSCHNSRKPMRRSPPCEMRSDSPALCPGHLRFPNQTRKVPRFAWLNSREYPTTLSQDEKNTDVNPGMQNCSVYPKSNWDEANFPCIGSITTPESTSYRTSGLTPFRNL